MSKPVLIVDDAVDIRRTLSLVFEMAGIPTVEAANGQEALEVLGSGERPRLVLLDWMMPILDGRAFLERVALSTELRELPVYVLSASDRQPDLSGVHIRGWLKKPVSYGDVLSLAQRHPGE